VVGVPKVVLEVPQGGQDPVAGSAVGVPQPSDRLEDALVRRVIDVQGPLDVEELTAGEHGVPQQRRVVCYHVPCTEVLWDRLRQ